MRRLLAAAALVLGLCGCGRHSRAILYAGIAPGVSNHRVRISDSAARAAARKGFAEWRAGLAADANRSRRRFPNFPPHVFRARLDAAAVRYGFTIEEVRFFHPRQLAPYVVVQTKHYLRLTHAIPKIERNLDPYTEKNGWAYEGFYLQADDERGIPFVFVSNLTRGQISGGQFARSEELYPFAHL